MSTVLSVVPSNMLPVLLAQPHVVSLGDKAAKSRRRVRAILGLPNTAALPYGLVIQSQFEAAKRGYHVNARDKVKK